MTQKTPARRRASWSVRALAWFARWLERKVGPPTQADFDRHESDWDYAQADLQPWDSEPDVAALSEALATRETDHARALTPLMTLAEQGSRVAMSLLGEEYYWGRGFDQDKAEAENWFRRAHELGSWRGALSYGKALIWRHEHDAAEDVFRAAADDGFAPALFWIARTRIICTPGRKTVLAVRSLLEQAAAQGSPAAKAYLSAAMAVGWFGLRHIPRGLRDAYDAVGAELKQLTSPKRKTASGETIH